jgi:predicted ATPase
MHLNGVALHSSDYPTKDHYPFNLPVLRQTERIPFTSAVTFFVGENGSGKSTLLQAMSRACGIHIWQEQFVTRIRHNPYENRLSRYLGMEWADGRVPGSFFGSDIFKNFARILEEWAAADPGQLDYFGGRSLLTQSHGQSTMSFFRSRFRVKGLYLLDEPEVALSPRSQLELIDVLMETGAAGHAQFIIATHSPILLACPGAVIYSFDDAPVRPVPYEETDYYKIYKGFLEDRDSFLKRS